MDGLITEIKTISRDTFAPAAAKSHNVGFGRREPSPTTPSQSDPTSSENILSILKSKPDQDEIARVLAILDPFNKKTNQKNHDIRVPSPITAQILNVLVSVTVPDHWDSLNTGTKGSRHGNPKVRAALLRCLSSVAGISCLVTHLRSLIAQTRFSQNAKASGSEIQIRDILSLITALLEPEDLALRLYTNIKTLYTSSAQKQAAWKEFISLCGASKVLSVSAEAITLIQSPDIHSKTSWVGHGSQYASWLGTNICHMASKTAINGEDDTWKAIASLTGRGLSLGYPDQLTREIYSGLLVRENFIECYALLFTHLRWAEQIAFAEGSLRDIQKQYLSNEASEHNDATSNRVVNGVAALCSSLIPNSTNWETQLVEWLSSGRGGSIHTVGLRRALLANLACREGLLTILLTKSLELSADKLYLQHAPIRSQEANTQVIAIAAGYLQRLAPTALKTIARTSTFLNAVSNRLAAASTKTRFLGMVIGTAISQLIEEPGKAMRFDLDEMGSNEAEWYLNLVKTEDSIGPLESIKESIDDETKPREKLTQHPAATKSHRSPVRASNPTGKIVRIEEINYSDEDEVEDEDLIPYAKPDEDPEDSDEDPTLIQRNKPVAPVYIRDLITYLRDTENLDRHELAITTAPSLIRRKTGFGTEIAENTDELALVLVGLQEQGKVPHFHEHRLQSMVALVVSQPLRMGRWFSAVYFDGDLSQTQRSAVLTALGLSARELAGRGDEDAKALGLPALKDSSFPSKRLPANLEALYLGDESPISALTRQLSQASLQPLAADAADTLTGPNALKVRTFSSRMEVEKKRREREAQRQKSTIKDLYHVLSEGFFYPLTRRFEVMISQFSSSTAPSHNPFLVPHLLYLFIQTLTLTLSTMGPHTPFLPSITEEALTFLLSLHARPISNEPTIVSALLSLFLVVIDLNVTSGSSGEERLVTEFASQVMELREWAGDIFDRTPAVQDTSDPREQVRTMSAGVMVKLGEVIERYQGRLMGVNSGFKY